MATQRQTMRRQRGKGEEDKIIELGYPLWRAFEDDETIQDLMALAKIRIVREFSYDSDTFRGEDSHFIIGIGGRPSELARYVHEQTKCSFIAKEDLSAEVQEERPEMVAIIAGHAQLNILKLTTEAMWNQEEVQYDPATGIWRVDRACMAEFLRRRNAARLAKKSELPWDYFGSVGAF